MLIFSIPLIYIIYTIDLSDGSPFGDKIVIAHRGASGYLPEHTYEAKTAAAVMGADFLEQDLLLTKDDEVVVFHDNHLDRCTDVQKKYPGRARNDGKNYVMDFTLDELRQLRVTERFKDNNPNLAEYPDRFPANQGNFRIHTLQEELDLIQGLEKSLDRDIGIYPELKSPWFHRKNNKCLWCFVQPILESYGYLGKLKKKLFLQSFEEKTLREIHAAYPDLNLIQLLAYNDWNQTQVEEIDPETGEVQWINYDYSWMFQEEGMKRIKAYASGIGPWYPMLVNQNYNSLEWSPSNLTSEAKRNGLKIHAYTFRRESKKIPNYARTFDDYLDIFLYKIGIDGVFTDFPDLAVNFIHETDSAENGASICGLSILLMVFKILIGQFIIS